MKTTVHKEHTRGMANYGWLQARYSFSFAYYYNPERMNFGALRVLNDDYIAGGGGFPTHPHDNMEIITIPLRGALEHKDSMGNTGIIRAGDVQVMSAGTGVQHSEYNHSENEPIQLLQLWVLPAEGGVQPRYDQKSFAAEQRKNALQYIVSPTYAPIPDTLCIYQWAWLSRTELDKNQSMEYHLHKEGNGVYVLVLEGEAHIGEELLRRRDAIALQQTEQCTITTDAGAELLLIEVPM